MVSEMNKPRVSVITPVYNVEHYLEECVQSIINQTYKDIEIILVDDGSKDRSGIICDQLKALDSRITVIHQKNGGLPVARNSGLRIARGDFILFIDSDDWIDKRMIETLVDRIESTNSDVAVCNARVFNKMGFSSILQGRYNDEVIDYNDEMSIYFYYSALDACWNHLFRSNIIFDNNIEFVSKSVVPQEDYYFQIKVYSYAKRIVTISDALYMYRERGTSISKSGQPIDFPDKCLKFTYLTRDYISSNTDRKCENFYDYQFVNMLMTSINNVPNNRIIEIVNVIRLYRHDKYYRRAINSTGYKVLYPNPTKQHKYYRLIVKMIKSGLLMIPSCLEKMRISRLRSSIRTDTYYE